MSVCRIGDIARVQSGFAFKSSEFKPDGVKLLRNTNILPQRIYWDDLACLEASQYGRYPAYQLHSGDILLSLDRPIISSGIKVARVGDRDVPSLLVQRVGRLCLDGSRVNADYLYAFLRSPRFAQEVSGHEQSLGVPHISPSQVEAVQLPLPDLDEQRRIAARIRAQLIEAETARQAALAQHKSAEALVSAIYREACALVVPMAIPPTFDDPPAGWQWRKLTELARLESGHTPSRSRSDWWGGDVSWVSLTEIRALDGHWVESTQLRTNAAGIANSAARILPRGTVCYSRTASVGFVAIMAKPMATSQDFANWVCGDSLDPEFLMHALIRARKDLRDLATGATHKTIYMPTLESFHVCAPVIDAQRRIVRELKHRLAEVSALRAALDAQQKELSTLPQRLLAKAFEI